MYLSNIRTATCETESCTQLCRSSETATALIRESALEGNVISAKEAESMLLRSKIQEAVMDGHIDEAIEQTNCVAPEVL